MGFYNRRDDIGHFVDRGERTGQLCHHACCRGYRQHPKHWPKVRADKSLRSESDDELAARFHTLSADNSARARREEFQIIHEMERRDAADERDRRKLERDRERRERRDRAAANRAGAKMEREAETERVRVDAEAQTRGNLVNSKGRARGIHPDEILTGREAVFQRYASDEARDYFRTHPRPTAAYFRGHDTRMVERYR